MIDVGVNIASDTDPMPYFTAPEALPMEKMDAVILTHAHLDHAGMLPVLFRYGYRGPVYCTPPTRDMMLLLQSDYLKVGGAEGKRAPYDMEDIRTCMRHVVDVDWGQTVDIAPDMKLTFHNAGHILGSLLYTFMLETENTTSYSLEIKNTKNLGYLMLQILASLDVKLL